MWPFPYGHDRSNSSYVGNIFQYNIDTLLGEEKHKQMSKMKVQHSTQQSGSCLI